jgi:predicted dehydrogenase
VIAATHADAIKVLPQADLVACCDIVPERAHAFAQQYGIDSAHIYGTVAELLSDKFVDAVSVCTPSGTHAGIAADSLRAGKPVIVEKPVDVSLNAIALLETVQKETGLPVAVISQHRFDPASIYVHDLIQSGGLGSLVLCDVSIKWYRTQEYYDSGDWRGTWELDGGGALMNQGVHTVDLMRWFMGPVSSVYAVARTLAHNRIEVEDTLCAALAFQNGAIGNVLASTSAFPGFPAKISVHGQSGSATISGDSLTDLDFLDHKPFHGVANMAVERDIRQHALQIAQGGTKSAESQKTGLINQSALNWGDSHKAQISDFIDCVLNQKAPKVDVTSGLEAVKIILAAYESSRSGKAVVLS